MLRATLKSLRSRKLRLVLSGIAVVLGVMFVSGAFVLTSTLGASFDSLSASVYAGTDVAVSGKAPVSGGEPDENSATVPAELIGDVRAVSGVEKATGVVSVSGARVIGADGKVVTTSGPARLGTSWTGTADHRRLRTGREPRAADEIAVNASLAAAAGIEVGDRVGVLTLQPKKTFTLVGVFGYSGDRDTVGGAQEVSFIEPVAQELMLGRTGVYSAVVVEAAPGVAPEVLRDRLSAALGDTYDVKTGRQLQDAAAEVFREALSFFNNVLLGFAGVALFVGTFLILNTFSILVAQRVKELALMRAIGASRWQMIGSVLVEALVIGIVASALGLGAGIGVGALLAYVFRHVGNTDLPMESIEIPASAVVSAFAVGTLVTLVAALLPAVRAARVPPVAALREVAAPDRPLTRLTVAGVLITAIGGAALGLGLAGQGGAATMPLLLGGVLVSFTGIALLTPMIARPVVSVLGLLFSRSVPGRLGRLNSARNPRRTAITAAALMVGLALITGVHVVLESATASFTTMVDTRVKADLIISGAPGGDSAPTFDPAVLGRARQIGGVREVVGEYGDIAMINGRPNRVTAVTDLAAMTRMLPLRATEGTLATLPAGHLAVDAKRATELGLHAGSTVRVRLARGGVRTMTVAGVYTDDDVYRVGGWILPAEAAHDFRVAQPSFGYLRLADGADVSEVRKQIDALLADSPEVTVGDRGAFIAQQSSQFDTILAMIQLLLALAILIAVLGIVNTLALSVLERTRELGLLRAIGLRRSQAMLMIAVEAVVISVFGALLGLAVGSGLGATVVRALRKEGFTDVALPWERMGTYLVLAVIVGAFAATLPAIRAARVDVLHAIAHE
ncbi:ABC transporter permease [Actinoplanes sp. NEAU-A12]|uniref:ABC transporter permease n=1 Tax=Actinoplanes sandaracinus TaxID=3045177 RepID=A0ABT6WZW4_9ACTN|nr:ABC transporter permease [Actinoplanes sandaracinus]MDI6105141.1 ABC transporter permease [Actinoplanes sandaracinus]